MSYRTAMTRGIIGTIIAALTALTFGLAAPAQAHHRVHRPSHPAAHLRWEATQLGCQVDGTVTIPAGPRNQGVTCTRGNSQRYELIYYPRVLPAMHWWRTWVQGNSWVSRDGFIVIVPLGSPESGVDSGSYDREWAGFAAGRTDGRLLAI